MKEPGHLREVLITTLYQRHSGYGDKAPASPEDCADHIIANLDPAYFEVPWGDKDKWVDILEESIRYNEREWTRNA